MKKNVKRGIKTFLVSIMLAATFTVSSQDYYHAAGVQYSLGIFNIDYNSPSGGSSDLTVAGVPGVFYKSTLAFTDHFAVSAYPFIGLSLNMNSMSGASGSLGIELPVLAELYFGDLDDLCFFAGTGMSWSYVNNEGYGGSIFGPQFEIGGQFDYMRNIVGARLAFTYGINKTKLDIANAVFTKDSKSLFSLGVYYVFPY